MNREVGKITKAAKQEWTGEQCKDVEKGMMSGNSSSLTKTQQHKSAVIDDSSGNTMTESTAARNRWTEYCRGLYNYELFPDTSLL